MNDVAVDQPQLPAVVKRAELVAGNAIEPIVPRTVEEAYRLAQAVVSAKLAPDSYKNDPQAVMIGIMKSAEVGFPPLTGLSTIAIINGRPSIYGDGAVALCQRHGAIEWQKHRYEGTPNADDFTCHVEIKRRNQPEPYTGSFSVAQAKRAKLWGNPGKAPWMMYPERMLFNRARAFALRDGFADCLMGLSIAEEVIDLPAPPPDKPDTSFLDDNLIEHKPALPVELQQATPEIAAHPVLPMDAGNHAGGDGAPSASPAASIPPPLTKDGKVNAAYIKAINEELAMAPTPELVDTVLAREADNLAKIGASANAVRMQAARRKKELESEAA